MHGIDGQVYALVSSQSTQINALFVFLSSGRCPVLDSGAAASQCYSHPGSYLGAIGIQQLVGADGSVMKLALHSGAAEQGFSAVELNGVRQSVGAVYSSPATGGSAAEHGEFSFRFMDRHTVEVSTADFTFQLESSDHFINLLHFTPRTRLSSIAAHGLLGQTSSSRVHQSRLKVIEGEVDDYALTTNELFASDFAYNRFQQ